MSSKSENNGKSEQKYHLLNHFIREARNPYFNFGQIKDKSIFIERQVGAELGSILVRFD